MNHRKRQGVKKMPGIKLEVCCGSADDVIESWRAGADRVELNSSLFHGGLTPSIGSLIVAKEAVPIPIMAMVRPRPGGFCYTQAEYRTALADAKALLDSGADGLVFGFLHPDGTVDEARTRELKEMTQGRESVFHRAIDVTPDWKRALEILIKLGITRVLTSGQAPDVFFALDTIAEMIRFAQGAIQILPGAGVTLRNAARVAQEIGCSQIHIARHKRVADTSTLNNRDIFYGGALYPPEDSFEMIDGGYVAEVRGRLG
jgi:copper homeostasis protein